MKTCVLVLKSEEKVGVSRCILSQLLGLIQEAGSDPLSVSLCLPGLAHTSHHSLEPTLPHPSRLSRCRNVLRVLIASFSYWCQRRDSCPWGLELAMYNPQHWTDEINSSLSVKYTDSLEEYIECQTVPQ